MPRAAKPLNVSPEELETLKSNLARADEALAERIRIVMACAEESSNKEIAARFQVHERTVAKWKKAYQEKGINYLLSSRGGGRKAKHDGDKLEEQITALLTGATDDSSKSWTIKALADETGASEYQISVILKKLNISLPRKPAWNYQTSKTKSYPGSPEIIGIYLTRKRYAIVTAYHKDGIVTSSGEFCTGNRALARNLKQSDEHLNLNVLMNECLFYRDSGKDETVPLEDFIRRLINEASSPDLPSGNGSADKDPAGKPAPVRIGVFVFSDEQFASRQIWPSNVDYCSFVNSDEWLTTAHSWFGARSSGNALAAFEETTAAITRYLERRSTRVPCLPFIWSSRIIRTGAEESSDSGTGSVAADELPNSWLTLYENINKNAAAQSGFIFFTKGKNGIEFGSVVNERPLPDSDFSFDSEEDFLKSMNQLEREMVSMRDKAGEAAMKLYIDKKVKKKKQ